MSSRLSRFGRLFSLQGPLPSPRVCRAGLLRVVIAEGDDVAAGLEDRIINELRIPAEVVLRLHDGRELLRFLSTKQNKDSYDVLLTEVLLPYLLEADLMRALITHCAGKQVIQVTTMSEDDIIQLQIEAQSRRPLFSHVRKPYMVTDLKEMLSAAANRCGFCDTKENSHA